jgi:transposase-like protein
MECPTCHTDMVFENGDEDVRDGVRQPHRFANFRCTGCGAWYQYIVAEQKLVKFKFGS